MYDRRPSDRLDHAMSSIAQPYGIAPPGYRLPDATAIGAVRLQIANLVRSVAYYRDVIGLRVHSQTASRACLTAHDDDRVLVELHERPGVQPVSARGHYGLFHVAILLPDRPALGRFLSHLGRLGVRASMSDHFVSEAVYLTDPDGLGLEIYADRPRDVWRTRDRQIEMGTVPLDTRSLVAAGSGVEWTGAPAGTVVGHVHLHVGDLEQAATFYHRTIGFDKMVWEYPGALFLAAGGYHHHLGTNTWARHAQPARDDDARLLEWELVLPSRGDIDTLVAQLQQHSVAFVYEAGALRIRDPWGTAIVVRSAAAP